MSCTRDLHGTGDHDPLRLKEKNHCFVLSPRSSLLPVVLPSNNSVANCDFSAFVPGVVGNRQRFFVSGVLPVDRKGHTRCKMFALYRKTGKNAHQREGYERPSHYKSCLPSTGLGTSLPLFGDTFNSAFRPFHKGPNQKDCCSLDSTQHVKKKSPSRGRSVQYRILTVKAKHCRIGIL